MDKECANQTPLGVRSLDGAVRSKMTILRSNTGVEKKALNNISVRDLMVSVNGERCSDSHEKRKLLLSSQSPQSNPSP